MIQCRQQKLSSIVDKLRVGISEINRRYRRGPDLYFYRRVFELRSQADSVASFLGQDYNIEMLYATLVAWDMNSRAAKMKYFDDFKDNLLSTVNELQTFERLFINGGDIRSNASFKQLRSIYTRLCLMKSHSKLVSNSKMLHFLFPNILTPMDRRNSLHFFYGNHDESIDKYIEIVDLTFEILLMPDEWSVHLDTGWNTSIPKMIDNAILLIEQHSLIEVQPVQREMLADAGLRST